MATQAHITGPVHKQAEDSGEREIQSDLRPSRGVVVGIVLGSIFWVALYLLFIFDL